MNSKILFFMLFFNFSLSPTQEPLHDTCQTCVSDLRDLLQQYHESLSTQTEVKVPQHFDDKLIYFQEKLSELTKKMEQWTNQITETVASWLEFNEGLEELTKWVWSQHLELTSLQVLEEFANEFSSHQTRLKVSNLFGGRRSMITEYFDGEHVVISNIYLVISVTL